MGPNLHMSFWSRMGLQDEDREICMRVIQELYPGHQVENFEAQGYCSFTLSVSSSPDSLGTRMNHVVQIRPERHALDITIAEVARETYGRLAPEVRMLACQLPGTLRAVEMETLKGVTLSKIDVGNGSREKQFRLVESFAKAVAKAWPVDANSSSSRRLRADTPTEGLWLEHCTGKVGSVIVSKLRKLAADLPDEALRMKARKTLADMLVINSYPLVLNHGDLIPSNILMDEDSWEVTGLVDWAEAEMLPFGMCFYGLEFLLGGSDTDSSGPNWTYRQDSDALRDLYWQTLVKESPGIGMSAEVKCMRDAGVLLWFGYAWDEGAIDRVVNEVDDAFELVCLRAFLGVQ